MAPGRRPRSFSRSLLRYIDDDIHPVSSLSLACLGGFLTSTPILNMLAFLSFVCAIFLAVSILVRRIRTSVPRLSIILWLFGYNLVHGINALVWSGNVDIHIPVWCDIGEFLVFFLLLLLLSNKQPFNSYQFHVGCQPGRACGILMRLTTTRTPFVDKNHSFSSNSSSKSVDIRHFYVLPATYNLHLAAYV